MSQMATLTCKNHPELRWLTKTIATNKDGSYNGIRNIFFQSWPDKECDCKTSELTWAPEETFRHEEVKPE